MGIVWGDWLFFQHITLPLYLIGGVILTIPILLFALYRYVKKYALRWVFGATTFLFFLLFGLCWSNLRLQQEACTYPDEEAIYSAVITAKPEAKEKSMMCYAHVTMRHDFLSSLPLNTRKVILYFPLDSAANAIRNGDELLLSARLALPQSNGNPDEFDYSRYLRRKGVYGTGFVSSGKWKVVHHHSCYSVRKLASDCRESVLQLYHSLGLSKDEYAVLSALTVGYKDDLSEDIRESFSISGASHVLAVSGLHVGFLYILFLSLLQRLPGHSRVVCSLKLTWVIILLWGFAFITGLSPSVVRAVTMCSLLAISRSFPEGRNVSLNTLATAGMGMLIYHPDWLFDVGFQLSFAAVAAILLLQPWLYKQITLHNTWADKLWQLISISIAAQIGAAPLVIFYFSRFSVHFLLTNILVIPLVTLIIYGAFAMLLCSFIPYVNTLVALFLKCTLSMLIGVVRGIEQLPLSSIDGIWVCRTSVWLFYLLILLLMAYLHRYRVRYAIAGLAVLLLMSTTHLYTICTNRPEQSIIFYNVRQCPAVHCTSSDGRSWLAYADSVPDKKRLLRATSNYWNRLRLHTPIDVVDNYHDVDFLRHDNVLAFNGKRVCIINSNRWRKQAAEIPFPLDYLYLCKGYEGKVEELMRLFSARHIIIDASLSVYRRNMLQEECRKLGLPCTSLAENGVYKCLI